MKGEPSQKKSNQDKLFRQEQTFIKRPALSLAFILGNPALIAEILVDIN